MRLPQFDSINFNPGKHLFRKGVFPGVSINT